MTKLSTMILAAALVAAAAPAHAAGAPDVPAGDYIRTFNLGNDLKKMCDTQQQFHQGYCAGYAAAQADSLSSVGQLLGHDVACIPNEVSTGQVRDVILAYLNKHPETRHWAATGLAVVALREAFPCKGQREAAQ